MTWCMTWGFTAQKCRSSLPLGSVRRVCLLSVAECAVDYLVSPLVPPMTAWAAESRAMGTRYGEQLT